MRICRWLPLPLLALALLLPPLAAEPQPESKKAGPRLDHYGDPQPEHALLRIGTIRFRPGGIVTALAFTAKDSRLVTINRTTGAHVWDVATGKELLAFGRPASEQAAIAVSPDGTVAALVEADDKCHLYDTATGREATTIQPLGNDAVALRFSHDNRYLGSVGNVVRIWQVATGTPVRHWANQFEGLEWGLAFSSDDTQVALGSPYASPIGIWEMPDGKLLRKVGSTKKPNPPIIGGPGIGGLGTEVRSYDLLAFSPNGKILTAHDAASQDFVLWEAASGKPLHKIPQDKDNSICCVAFSPDSITLATGNTGGEVHLWDTATGKRLRVFAGHKGWVSGLAFSADGKRLAASDEATIRICDLATGQQVHSFAGHTAPSVDARFTTDGKTIVSTSHSNVYMSDEWFTLHFWDSSTGKARQQTTLDPKGVMDYRVSADGRVLAFADKERKLHIRNLESGKDGPTVEQVKGSEYFPQQFTADGRYLVGEEWVQGDPADSERESLRVWNTATGKIVFSLKGRVNDRFNCRFTDDGRHLVVHTWPYGEDNSNKQRFTLAFWDILTGRKVVRPKSPLDELARALPYRLPQLSPSGRLLDLTVNYGSFYELATGKVCFRLRTDKEHVSCVAISPDGRTIAAGSEQGSIFIWDFSSDKPLAKLTGHRRRVSSLGFSADGKRLVSGGDDTTILVWNMSPWTNQAANAAKPLPAEVAAKLWTDLGHEDAAKGYAALGQFLQSPKDTVAFLREKLRPIEATATQEIAKCIAELDNQRYAEREQAMAKLEKHGLNAFAALDKTLSASPTLEMRRRVELLLSKLESQPFTTDSLQTLRALELLEMLGTPDAADLLDSLSHGEPDAWLTQEAAASLERVRKRAAP